MVGSTGQGAALPLLCSKSHFAHFAQYQRRCLWCGDECLVFRAKKRSIACTSRLPVHMRAQAIVEPVTHACKSKHSVFVQLQT